MGSVDPSSDEELLRAHVEGDQDAFGELVRRHERRAYALAMRMTAREEDARDAAQDAFIAVLRHAGSFRGDARFSTWFHRIVVNACYDVLRRRDRAPLSLVEDAVPDVADPRALERTDEVEFSIDLEEALQQVPEEHRAVLLLHDVHDLPYEEIARVLEVPIGTVKSRLHRGRAALGRALGVLPTEGAAGGAADGEPDRGPGPSQTRDRSEGGR